jgi:ssDNA-binding Zn-finger/Zn-ribbon topoisomerase 1
MPTRQELTEEDLLSLIEALPRGTVRDNLAESLTPRLRTKKALKAQYPEHATNLPCPVCKRKLLLKDGKFGVFYGCSEYPTCRGSIDADQATAAPLNTRHYRCNLTVKSGQVDVPPALVKARREAEDRFELLLKKTSMVKRDGVTLVSGKLGAPLCFDDMTLEQCELVKAIVTEKLRPKSRFDLIKEGL